MFLIRASVVWLVLMAAEVVHGTLRALLLVPVVGDFRARQISVFTGSLLILGLTYLFIRWIRAGTIVLLLAVGLLVLTISPLLVARRRSRGQSTTAVEPSPSGRSRPEEAGHQSGNWGVVGAIWGRGGRRR